MGKRKMADITTKAPLYWETKELDEFADGSGSMMDARRTHRVSIRKGKKAKE